jgi:methyl-accepting chemotaxis protein
LVQSGKEKVDTGVTVAKQCSDVLNEIVQNVSRVSGLSLEISQAAKEQAQGVSEINKAMSQLDTVTQQNAATSEEAASAAEELSGQAESLKSSVEDLMAVISGNRNVVASGPVSRPVPIVTKAPKSNIVHIKAAKPKARKTVQTESKSFQKASGDESSIPDRDDDGFKDV